MDKYRPIKPEDITSRTFDSLEYNISMLIRISLLMTLIFSLVSGNVLADDELLLIQAVSVSGKTFVIRKGAEDGISIGQQSLFSTKNSSFTAVVIEVNRFFSLWQLKDNRGAVPFEKGNYITYTNNIENIWTEIPKLQVAPKEELVFKESHHWTIRGNYTLAMSESVSNTDDEKTTGRVGYQLELLYGRRFTVHWEWGVGGRLDRENTTIQEPALDIPSNRYMLTAELLYHFPNFYQTDNNAYLGIALAYGISNTTIDETVSTGTTMALPIVKAGYINKVAARYSVVFELAVEALAQSESFADTDEQTTNIINTKASIGVRF